MRLASEVTATKLRGGFYTPASLVARCFDRVAELLPTARDLRVLEPAAGDGQFVAGAGVHAIGPVISTITAVEPLASEAAKARQRAGGLDLAVHESSFLADGAWQSERYDVVVGNPPFVRFQFVGSADQAGALRVGEQLGVSLRGVSNLWIPIVLRALSMLVAGGAFALVVPAEILTGISAAVVRTWLLEHCEEVAIELLVPGSFPAVLQEVVVLSGRRTRDDGGSSTVGFIQRGVLGTGSTWHHVISPEAATWTRFLLTPHHVVALRSASTMPGARALGEVARFEVATVTGANGFFTVDRSTVSAVGLEPWARPLLPRVRHAPGLVFTSAEQDALDAGGQVSTLLDFAADRPDPGTSHEVSRYLDSGMAAGLHERFKCRTRSPWFRVPVVAPGALLLSKRSHWYPRMIVNDAGVHTTDTIYRGRMTAAGLPPRRLAASFHSSLTLLSAEVEGRSFGGGVLELVPTEIARLLVVLPEQLESELPRLDATARADDSGGERLVEQTDRLVCGRLGLDAELLATLREARHVLLRRRLDRAKA